MSNRMPDRMPDRMSEDMPDRMSEDMPHGMPDRYARHVKWDELNAMVGITRTKVFFYVREKRDQLPVEKQQD